MAYNPKFKVADVIEADGSSIVNNGKLESSMISDASLASGHLDALTAASGNYSMNSNKLTSLAAPTSDTDAATKGYVDGLIEGISAKSSVVVASTANIATLSDGCDAGETIDGVTLVAGDRVLLKDQTTTSENGIYIVGADGVAPARAADMAAGSNGAGVFVWVEEGSTQADSGWLCNTDEASAVVATNNLVFVQFSGAGQITAGAAMTKSGNTLNVAVDDSSIGVNNDELYVKALGITNAMLEGSITNAKLAGSIANSKLVNSAITVTDGSSTTSVSLGGSITYTAGEGMDVTESSGEITFACEDATSANKGVASFAAADFSLSSGAVSLVDLTVAHMAAGAVVLASETIAANDSDLMLPTAAAVIDYVAAQITAEDLDFTGDSGTGAVDLDSASLAVTGSNGITTTASGAGLSVALDGNQDAHINSILTTDLVLGEDAETKIDFADPNVIAFFADNASHMTASAAGVTMRTALIVNGGRLRQGGELDLGTAARTLTWGDEGSYDLQFKNELHITASSAGSVAITLPGAGDLGASANGQFWDVFLENDFSNSYYFSTSKTIVLTAPAGVKLNGTNGGTYTIRASGMFELAYELDGSDHNFYLMRRGDAKFHQSPTLHNAAGAIIRSYNGYASDIHAGYSAANKVASVSADGALTASGGTMFTAGGGGAMLHQTEAHASSAVNQDKVISAGAYIAKVTMTHAGCTAQLPAAAAGRVVVVKDYGSSQDWELEGFASSGATIDGAAHLDMTVANTAVSLFSDGTNWFVF